MTSDTRTLPGRYARIGNEMKQAVELAIEERNAAGGIRGVRVSSDAADDKSSAETGEEVARQFCMRADLLGVVGHYDVTIAASARSKAGLPVPRRLATCPTLKNRRSSRH